MKKLKGKNALANLRSIILLILLVAIPITIFSSRLPQTLMSSAETVFSTPPIFYCLTLGRSNKQTCSSQSLNGNISLSLHAAPLTRNKIVYYNDQLVGSVKYTNTGDTTVKIKSMGLAAVSGKGNKRVDFLPQIQDITVLPGKSITLPKTAYMFRSPDPGGTWSVFSTVTLQDGSQIDNNDQTIISVSTACTALRAIPATGKDMLALQLLCAGHRTNSLCKSKQYCEISGKASCDQSAPSQEYIDNNLQCDQNIVMPDKEQDLLEQLCKEYPSTDTCKDFCARTYGSAICPDPNVDNTIAQTDQPKVAGASTELALMNTVCRAGQLFNYLHECCASGTCLRPDAAGNMLCSRACGASSGGGASGGSAPACKTFSAKENRCCPSGVKNTSDQCCLYNGPLLSNGLCPLGNGKGGTPPPRVVPINGTPARVCAAGQTRNANGTCGPGTGINDPLCGAYETTTCKICYPGFKINGQGLCN